HQKRGPGVEIAREDRRGEIFHPERTPELQKARVGIARHPELGVPLDPRLFLEALGDPCLVSRLQPGRVEELEVVADELGVESTRERMAAEEDRKRPSVFEAAGARQHLLERHLRAQMTIDRVQAGRPAAQVVGLAVDDEGYFHGRSSHGEHGTLRAQWRNERDFPGRTPLVYSAERTRASAPTSASRTAGGAARLPLAARVATTHARGAWSVRSKR